MLPLTCVSRYELLERIGVGGMAEVFRGVVTSVGGFKKDVAIKKILPHLGRDERFVRMLIAEAKILANLRQRNIVQIYDVAQGEDGEYFLSMEFVEGSDLAALYERMEQEGAKMSVSAALHVGAEVCEALDHAHRVEGIDGKVGLVHRDVSLSNVLLSYAGEVKLTDFGIAKAQNERSVIASLKGKFAYMSPEQARAQVLGPATDLYSLGIVLFELLTGRRLFSHLTDLDALRFVREGRVPRPTAIDGEFPARLEDVLMKALANDPRDRYASAADMGTALREYRYSATTGGDPGREVAKLVHKYFPSKKVKPPEATHVVRLTTVAGFPTGDFLLEDALATEPGTGPIEDAPTRAMEVAEISAARENMQTGRFGRRPRRPRPPPAPVDDFDLSEGGRREESISAQAEEALSALRAESGAQQHSPPPFLPVERAQKPPAERAPQPPVDRASLPFAPLLPAERGPRVSRLEPPPARRPDTPTVKDVFPAGGALPQHEEEHAFAAPVQAEDPAVLQRRRLLAVVIIVMVLAALVAFVIAGTMTDDAGPGIFRTPTGTGESLPAPQMKQPVKRRN